MYGTVTHWERDLATGQGRQYGPVPFVHVLLRGASRSDAQTDDRGRYEIAGIPPGTYDIQAVPPAQFSSKYLLLSSIELRDARACFVADFGVRFDGRISGVALAADGQPAAGLTLEAMSVERVGATGFVETLTTKTDGGGSFEFSEVPPGSYVVGASVRRGIEPEILYPRTFYPGVPVPSDATVIEVGEGTHQSLDPLRLPAARRSRELSGRVVWADGQPAAGASVSLSAGEATWQQVASGIQTEIDGRFTFVVHEGLSYTARASHSIPDDPKHRHAGAIVGPFVISDQTASLQLVLVAPREP